MRTGNSAHAIGRRDALRALCALGVTLILEPAVHLDASAHLDATANAPAWLVGDADLEVIRQLGRDFLRAHADDPHVGEIWKLLRDGSERGTATLRRRVTADYAADRVITLDGWWLSETEGRVFAAVALNV